MAGHAFPLGMPFSHEYLGFEQELEMPIDHRQGPVRFFPLVEQVVQQFQRLYPVPASDSVCELEDTDVSPLSGALFHRLPGDGVAFADIGAEFGDLTDQFA